MGVLGYSTTAASNTTALTGVGSLAEGVMPIKQINDAIRQELADIAQLYGDVVAGITTTGTASAYVVATASGHAAYNNQMALRLRFHLDCAGGPTTVNVNVLGTKALKVFDTTGARDPVAGEIKADMVYDCVYVAALNCMIVTAHTNNFAGLTAAIAAKQDKDDDLTAIAAFGGTGIAVRTAANTWAQRQITSADGTVVITNPAGVAGDINLSAQADLIHVLASAHAGANVNTAQDLFPLDITLDANSVYQYELVFSQVKSAGATAHRMRYLFDGTVGVTTIHRNFYMSWDVGSSTAASSLSWAGFYGTTAEREFTNDMTNAGISTWMQERGVIITSTAGTFIPQYRLTAAPGGAYSTRAGSYFRLRKVGAAGGDIAAGPWA